MAIDIKYEGDGCVVNRKVLHLVWFGENCVTATWCVCGMTCSHTEQQMRLPDKEI